nr:MAG: RNA-dependent RNA polymerase [Grapevine umbra-like virus 2]
MVVIVVFCALASIIIYLLSKVALRIWRWINEDTRWEQLVRYWMEDPEEEDELEFEPLKAPTPDTPGSSTSADSALGRKPSVTVRRRDRRKASRQIAIELRVKFGLLKDTPANRVILDREGRKLAGGYNVRKVDILQVIPMAVEWALLPTDADVEAREFCDSVAASSVKGLVRPGKLRPRVVRMRGVDTTVISKPPPGTAIGPPRGPIKSVLRRCLVVEAPKPHLQFAIHNSSLVNVVRGVVERVYYRPVDGKLVEPPKPDWFDARMSRAFKRLCSWTPKTPVWTRDQVILSYAGDRRRVTRYTKAKEELEVTPLQADDARLETFVKCEKIDFTTKGDPAPRVIQPRRPRFLLECGRYIKPMEGILYSHIGRRFYGEPCIAKGFNAVQTAKLMRGKWDRFTNPVAISMDASRFDQHVSVDALSWTHRVYRCFNNDPYFVQILNMMYLNKGKALAKDGSLRYMVSGRRMSGDMDTALGNCLLMCSMVWSLCKDRGIRHEVMDNGDDIVLFMDESDLGKLWGVEEWFLKLGFVMKVEAPVRVFEQIDFCQTHPVWNGREWIMCRGIRAIAKDMVCTVGVDSIYPWLKAVGECNMALCSGVPVLQAVYSWMAQHESHVRADLHPGFACGLTRMVKGLKREWREVTEESRLSFYKATGLLPDHQVALEGEFESLGRAREFTGVEIEKDEQQYNSCAEVWAGDRPGRWEL